MNLLNEPKRKIKQLKEDIRNLEGENNPEAQLSIISLQIQINLLTHLEYGERSVQSIQEGYSLSQMYLRANLHEQALSHAAKILTLMPPALRQKKQRLQIVLLLTCGVALSRLKNYEEALGYLHRAEAVRDKIGLSNEHRCVISVRQAIATCYSRLEDHGLALGELSILLATLRKTEGPHSLAVASLHAQMMKEHIALGQVEEADAACQAALAIYDEHEKPTHAAPLLYNMGMVYADEELHSKAVELLQKALAHFTSLNQQEPRANTLELLAEISENNNQIRDAISFLSQAIDIRSKMNRDAQGPHLNVAAMLKTQGVLFLHVGKPKEALVCLQQAYGITVVRKGTGYPMALEVKRLIDQVQAKLRQAAVPFSQKHTKHRTKLKKKGGQSKTKKVASNSTENAEEENVSKESESDLSSRAHGRKSKEKENVKAKASIRSKRKERKATGGKSKKTAKAKDSSSPSKVPPLDLSALSQVTDSSSEESEESEEGEEESDIEGNIGVGERSEDDQDTLRMNEDNGSPDARTPIRREKEEADTVRAGPDDSHVFLQEDARSSLECLEESDSGTEGNIGVESDDDS
eukprot:GCRY01003945.1.p1 GENE.GCRY01003945.1~~GCRY01003945.1.p1  ORF type:complete len:580 (+),score=127.10 GCRY01003945.1:300-2039(+)